jgi:transposase-like protein
LSPEINRGQTMLRRERRNLRGVTKRQRIAKKTTIIASACWAAAEAKAMSVGGDRLTMADPPQRWSSGSIVSRVIDKRENPSLVAHEFRVTPRTVHKWVRRFRTIGFEGLRDRSSRPHRIPRQQLKPDSSELRDAVFALLHSPPTDSGLNRTTWRLSDLKRAKSQSKFRRCQRG